MNRRDFVKTISAGTAGLGAAAIAAPAFARGRHGIPPSDLVRVGVIGVGSRGRDVMRRMLRVPGVEIGALCDIYEPSIALGREIVGDRVPVFRDYRRMLDEERELDAVLVATPLNLHGAHAVASLEAGLHVYGEKSMAYTVEECDAIVAAVNASGKRFQIGHQFRYAPWYREAIERIRAGEIGDVTHLFAFWHRNNNWRRPVPNPADERLVNWRLYLESSRGLLAELGSHQIDVANWIFGEHPTSVIGNGGIRFYHDGRETFDHVQAVFSYPSGGTLVFSSLLGNHRRGFQIWIYGTAGSVELTLADGYYYAEPWQASSAFPVEGVETGATLKPHGDMPDRTAGWKIEAGGDHEQLTVDAFFADLRAGRRPYADEHVGRGAAVPVVYGHQAVREGRRVVIGEGTAASGTTETGR